MKKKFALGALMAGIMLSAFAAETRYFRLHYSQNVGPEYCEQVWPGSHFNGFRQDAAPYYYISCVK
ncbi:hypothetical protein MJ904_15940 [Massilia sp. MB5]|uniref:hypothetical protein n=1 Tax=unclassified Massilia TaxID=2609279 RepID=UPI00067BD89F|nr:MULTISPECIES: hypothetical protein [unclassified Massilia]AKU21752.1 hypothetical protein ACZ75_10015 [Massilia sp. NR 4-1]UMR28630.1 hypothetical protein MJ904_15940 [Massilia sp. MB5]